MLRGWDPGRVLGSGTNPTVEVLESATGHCRGITLHAWLPGDLNSQEEMPSPPRPVHSKFTRPWGVTVKDPPRHALPQVYTPGPGTSSYRASCRSLKPPFQGLQSQSLSPLEFSICSLFPFEALPCPFPSPFVPAPLLYHRSRNITQIGLKIAILLPWPPNCYYHMHVTIHAVQKKLLFGIPYPLAGK